MAARLARSKIRLYLIQISEAHSSLWPVALPDQPEPQQSYEERRQRALRYQATDQPPYPVLVDGWDNHFQNTFHAWPDKYFIVDATHTIRYHSQYGNALIKEDLLDILPRLAA